MTPQPKTIHQLIRGDARDLSLSLIRRFIWS